MRLSGIVNQNIRQHAAAFQPFGHAHKLAAVLHVRSHSHYLCPHRQTAAGYIVGRFMRIHIMNDDIHPDRGKTLGDRAADSPLPPVISTVISLIGLLLSPLAPLRTHHKRYAKLFPVDMGPQTCIDIIQSNRLIDR